MADLSPADLIALKSDVDKLKQERRGWVARAKDIALIIGLFGGAVSLISSGIELYDRLTPAAFSIQASADRIQFRLDSLHTRLTLTTSVLFRNTGGDEDAVSTAYAALLPIGLDQDSAINFSNGTLKRTDNSDAQPFPIPVPPNQSANYVVELTADYSPEQQRMLAHTGPLQLRLLFGRVAGKPKHATLCFNFGPLVEVLNTGGQASIQPLPSCPQDEK